MIQLASHGFIITVAIFAVYLVTLYISARYGDR